MYRYRDEYIGIYNLYMVSISIYLYRYLTQWVYIQDRRSKRKGNANLTSKIRDKGNKHETIKTQK